MMHRLLLVLLSLILTSCATVITRRYYNMEINTNYQNAKVLVCDSLYNLPADLKVKRSKNDLKIKLFSDSLTRDYLVKSSPNPAFVFGNLLWMEVSPATYLIDFTNQKRFFYGKSVYLNADDPANVIRPPLSKFYYDYFSKSYSTNKGQTNLVLSLPWINSFYLQPQNESKKSNTGFWGISGGIEYFYKNNKFMGFTGNAVMDFFVPVPAAIDISGEYETMNSVYVSLTDNFKFNRFTVGYGLNYSKNNWAFRYSDRFDPPPPTREPVEKSSQSIGFTVNGYHQFGEYFFVGIIYRPSLIEIYPKTQVKYEHLISLDFAWKIRLKK